MTCKSGMSGARPMWGFLVSFLVAASATLPHTLVGQQVEAAALEGRVRDVAGGAIAGAIVQVSTEDGRRIGASETSPLGQYQIAGLAAGTYRVYVRRISYRPDTSQVTLTPGQTVTLDIALGAAPIALEAITVRVNVEQSRERVRFEEIAGATRRTLTGPDMKRVPGLVEPDPIRAVEVLPGVVSTSDVTAAFNVRGGSADQNLILLDGAPIFNPFHLGGIFSVFNSDIMERAELLSGGFPAEYGGRVSSVLTVESDAGDGDFHGDIGISLLASRLALGGGVPNGLSKTIGFESVRWRVSGRRSYLDQFSSQLPYHLIDGQGVLEAWTSGGSRLQITAYSGRDVVRPEPDLFREDSTDSGTNVDWTLGNDVFGARWTAPKADGGFVEVRSSFSRFKNTLDASSEDAGFDFIWGSRIESYRGGIDIEEHLGQSWTLRTGVGTERLAYDNFQDVNNARYDGSNGNGWLHGGYLQANWADHGWLVEFGARLDHWRPRNGEAKWEPAPRIAVKRFIGDDNAAIKLAAGRYTQFLHSLRDEVLPIGIDNWVLTGEQAPVVMSDQVQLGYEQYLGSNWFASLEGYLRRFDGLTTLNNGFNPNDAGDYLLRGDGTSYGADFFLRKTG
ncbi:carboxypeptidase regulatory-like domain-containing protein, partial [Gemmatimonadota bacterium]